MQNLIQDFQNPFWTPVTNVRKDNKIEWYNYKNRDQFTELFWTEWEQLT